MWLALGQADVRPLRLAGWDVSEGGRLSATLADPPRATTAERRPSVTIARTP
jgi:hypothetical protein